MAGRSPRGGGAPGEHFHYCNLGYEILGRLLATLDGRPLCEILPARIFQPLGMSASAPVISHALRPRMPVSYWPLYDDRPFQRHGPLVEAPYLALDNAAGCIASTPHDMALYVRMLLKRGRGPQGPLTPGSERSPRSTPRSPATGPTRWWPLPWLRCGPSASAGRSRRRRNSTIPTRSPTRPTSRGRSPLRTAASTFWVSHPDFALFPLSFAREKDAVVEAAWGPDGYAGERYAGPRAFETPAEWRAFAGHYRNDSPWEGSTRVVLRKGSLWLGDTLLVPLGPGLFRLGEEDHAPDRVRFEDVIGGRTLRAVFNGIEYRRIET